MTIPSKDKILQLRYFGFLQTPNLWKENTVYQLKQLELDTNIDAISIAINEQLRLGKYVEQFVLFNLSQQQHINLLANNIQIQQEKRTIGELDCIYKEKESIVHLEIVYKFYLYLPDKNKEELNCLVGPNRRDALIEKLVKLKDKQLQLLFHNSTKPYLQNLNITSNNIQQEVCFKAQVFLPLKNKNIVLQELNNNCIAGFYLNVNELANFKDCKFYIPIKKDWLLIPHQEVSWLSYNDFKANAKSLLSDKYSPLCWLKKSTGQIEKFFLVWWFEYLTQ